MNSSQLISLLQLRANGRAQVIELTGGMGFQSQLDSLGIRPGKVVQKITAQPLRGPLLIELDGSRIAIGRGMASKILVKELPGGQKRPR